MLLQAGYEDDVASQRLPAVLEGADELTVAFNPSYLMDALASFDAPVVQFESGVRANAPWSPAGRPRAAPRSRTRAPRLVRRTGTC